MALTDENGGGIPATMLVGPTGGNGGFGGGLFGGDLSILVLFFLFMMMGGWGNGFGGGFGGMDGLYPWMNNSQNINSGFRDQMLNTSINGIQNSITAGFGDVQNALCGGFAGVNASINGAQNAAATTARPPLICATPSARKPAQPEPRMRRTQTRCLPLSTAASRASRISSARTRSTPRTTRSPSCVRN